jgi:hypothetical protein
MCDRSIRPAEVPTLPMVFNRRFIEMTYYETYYFANLVKNVLEDPFEYLRNLDNFYGDLRYLNYTSPFPRYSAFHSFIRFLLEEVLDEEASNLDLDIRQDTAHQFQTAPGLLDTQPSKLPVNWALDRFGIKHKSFDTWLASFKRPFLEATDDDVEQYYEELRLSGHIEELLDYATTEVFLVLFQNRHALLLFNEMMAGQISHGARNLQPDSRLQTVFARPGVLKRVALPAWVQRAVLFRDRGMCVLCAADISGLLAIGSEENYDHIVPLASGGLNDVTNIQFLCKPCNSKKRAGQAITTNRHEVWYPDDD